MNKIGVCCLPSIVHTHYFSIIFNEKKCALYSIKYSIHLFIYAAVVVAVLQQTNCNDNSSVEGVWLLIFLCVSGISSHSYFDASRSNISMACQEF
jgi:hypothetical protein